MSSEGSLRTGAARDHGTSRRRLTVALALVTAGLSIGAQSPMFYPDDPIQKDYDTEFDASGVAPIPPSEYYDFIENTFLTPGDDRLVPAANTNTIDEVPDSTWFTNRIGARPMSLDEIRRGSNEFETLSVDGWPVVEGKGSGRTPGWRVAAPDGTIYQLEFDPREFPERTSGAEIIGSRFYHAIGFNTAESYLVDVDPGQIVAIPDATVEIQGRRQPFTQLDIDAELARSAQRADGRYRAVASRFIDGLNLGPFRYYGTRVDDPNDLFPHEHRRELRANRVFAAWLNHVDSRGINSLDALVGPEGSRYVRHYMFDFGSIIGGGPGLANEARAGNEYILDWGKGFKTLASLGLYVRPWLSVRYPDVPVSVGRFEAESFDPESWRPEYPNPAFRNMRLDDAYWGARIVSRFTDEAIRSVVEEARYTDHVATDYITDTLIARRDKVAAFWLNEVNPVDRFRLSASGQLTFENSAVLAGVATPPDSYVLSWQVADNATGDHETVGEDIWVTTPVSQMPDQITHEHLVAVVVRGIARDRPGWLRSTRVHFRRTAGGWDTVGVERAFDERLPDSRPNEWSSPAPRLDDGR